MKFSHRRGDRPVPARRTVGASLDALERRELLSGATLAQSPWIPADLPVYTAPDHQRIPYHLGPLMREAHFNPQSSFLGNDGKIVSGKDRQGNEWAITVHGPGIVIVTDTSPYDASLDDPIDTIQLVGTNPRTTYVTGQS